MVARVPRRRDVRSFGPGPYVLGLRRTAAPWGSGFPYDVPAVAAVERLRTDTPITLLAGDNGTRKSTPFEALAAAVGLPGAGGGPGGPGGPPPGPPPGAGGAPGAGPSATQ